MGETRANEEDLIGATAATLAILPLHSDIHL